LLHGFRLFKGDDPVNWYYYHTLYAKKRNELDEVPYVEIGKMITRPEFVVADLGCGENLLSNEIPNKVLAFDHVAIDENVTQSDAHEYAQHKKEIIIIVIYNDKYLKIRLNRVLSVI